MHLTTTTDFELAFYLLGCYEQEVKQTGMIDYPVHYEEDLSSAIDSVEELSPPLARDTWVNNFELSCDLPTPPHQNIINFVSCSTGNSDSQPTPALTEINVPIPTAIIPVHTSSSVIAGPEDISESSRQPSLEEQLLKHQEEERRLFYLYVQELESSADLTKLPQVIRP